MYVADIIARKGERFGNLTVYPLTMRDYELLQDNKPCLTIMAKRIGVEFVQIPYLRMITLLSNKEINLLGMLSIILSHALRISEDQIRIQLHKDSGQVALVIVTGGDKPEIIETISEMRFNKLRELIASQNNIKLPNEKANIEILESEEALNKMNSLGLNVDFKSLFFSVATYCGLTSESVLDMTIFEFEERVSAISRITKHQMYGQGELSGMVSFKGGNPYPSWCFDRKEDGLHGTIPLAQFQQRVGNVITQK